MARRFQSLRPLVRNLWEASRLLARTMVVLASILFVALVLPAGAQAQDGLPTEFGMVTGTGPSVDGAASQLLVVGAANGTTTSTVAFANDADGNTQLLGTWAWDGSFSPFVVGGDATGTLYFTTQVSQLPVSGTLPTTTVTVTTKVLIIDAGGAEHSSGTHDFDFTFGAMSPTSFPPTVAFAANMSAGTFTMPGHTVAIQVTMSANGPTPNQISLQYGSTTTPSGIASLPISSAGPDTDRDGTIDADDTDDDGDNVTDVDEASQGSDPLDPTSRPDTDDDGDGFSNSREARAQTDPNDANSQPAEEGLPWTLILSIVGVLVLLALLVFLIPMFLKPATLTISHDGFQAVPRSTAAVFTLTLRTRGKPAAQADGGQPAGDNYDVVDVEGIGPTYGEKLKAAGINTTLHLLGRNAAELAGITDAPETTARQWVAMADLMRVKGIGKQFAEALARVGVTSVADLADRDAKDLATIVQQDQQGRSTMGVGVTEKSTKNWIKEAKKLAKSDAKGAKVAPEAVPGAAPPSGDGTTFLLGAKVPEGWVARVEPDSLVLGKGAVAEATLTVEPPDVEHEAAAKVVAWARPLDKRGKASPMKPPAKATAKVITNIGTPAPEGEKKKLRMPFGRKREAPIGAEGGSGGALAETAAAPMPSAAPAAATPPGSGPQISMSKMVHEPTNFAAGDTVKSKMTITNSGGEEVKNLKLSLFVNDVLTDTKVVDVKPGKTKDVVFKWTAQPDKNRVYVRGDLA